MYNLTYMPPIFRVTLKKSRIYAVELARRTPCWMLPKGGRDPKADAEADSMGGSSRFISPFFFDLLFWRCSMRPVHRKTGLFTARM